LRNTHDDVIVLAAFPFGHWWGKGERNMQGLALRPCVATILSLSCLVFPDGAAATEVHFSFTRVTDTSVPMPRPVPNYSAYPNSFGIPSIDNGRVSFFGGIFANGHNPGGIYTYANGSLSVVADWYTPIPNGPVTGVPPMTMPFVDFGPTAVSGNTVAFLGGTPYDPGDGGVYRSAGGVLSRVADKAVQIPNTSESFFQNTFARIDVSGNRIVFTGTNNIFADPPKSGVYVHDGSSLSVVADTSTPVPGGAGNFVLSSPGAVSIDGNDVAFVGTSATGSGVYRYDGAALRRVADTTMPIPGRTGSFTRFDGLSVRGGDVVFGADGGIYISRNGAAPERVVDGSTPTPGQPLYGLGLHGDPALDAGNLAFTASNAVAWGLYTTLGGQLTKVIDTTDVFDGKSFGIFSTFGIGSRSISGNQIAFTTSLGDNSTGVYIANRVDVQTQTTTAGTGSTSVTLPTLPQIPGPIVITWRGPASQKPSQFTERAGRFGSGDTFARGDFGFDRFSFAAAGALTQVWDLSADANAPAGPYSIDFTYDPTLLGAGVNEVDLRIYHFDAGQWVELTQTIDTATDTIHVQTPSLSPFALGAVPEPSALSTVLLAWIVCRRRCRKSGAPT
jgi:hypothetical protein